MNLDDLLEEFKDEQRSPSKPFKQESSWSANLGTLQQQKKQSQQAPFQTNQSGIKDSWDSSSFDLLIDDKNGGAYDSTNPYGSTGIGGAHNPAQKQKSGGVFSQSPLQQQQVNSLMQQQKSKKDSILDDDLDDLINDISSQNGYGGGGSGETGTTSKMQQFKYEVPQLQQKENKSTGGKCYPLYIGGSSLQDGQCLSSLQPKSCDKLRCYNCDKKVHRFVDNKWKTSVDYLFVRNHNTNLKALVQGLERAPGSAAYACQCKWLSIVEPNQNEAENLSWFCAGH